MCAGQNNRPYLVMFCLLLHYTLYWCMAAFFNPEDEVSIGLHEKVGPCDVYQDVHTAFGMVSTTQRLYAIVQSDGWFDCFHTHTTRVVQCSTLAQL